MNELMWILIGIAIGWGIRSEIAFRDNEDKIKEDDDNARIR